MNDANDYVGYGWYSEDEDCIIATEKGLKKLKKAVEDAIDNGVGILDDDIFCVKKIDESYFEGNNYQNLTFLGKIKAMFLDYVVKTGAILFFAASFGIGAVTIVKYFLSLF